MFGLKTPVRIPNGVLVILLGFLLLLGFILDNKGVDFSGTREFFGFAPQVADETIQDTKKPVKTIYEQDSGTVFTVGQTTTGEANKILTGGQNINIQATGVFQTGQISPISKTEIKTTNTHYQKTVAAIQKANSKQNVKVVYGQTKLSDYYQTKQIKTNKIDKTQVDIKKESVVLVSTGTIGGELTITNIETVVASTKNRDTELTAPTLVTDAPSTAVVGEPGLERMKKLFQTIKVGSYSAQVIAGDNTTFQVSFQVPDGNVGENLDIYRSQDGKTWEQNIPDTACMLDTDKYCSFKTNHLTYFSVGVPESMSGTFTINNDAQYTTGLSVTLNINASGATLMRFGNSTGERDAASWVSYDTAYSWTLTGTNRGAKTVYAEFANGTDTGTVTDFIIFNWDNDNFLDQRFWSLNPTSGQIINALYGDGSGGVDRTAYTQLWSGTNNNTCITGNMNVVYVGNYDMSGVNSMPNTGLANTVYVLTGGRYANSDSITISGNCIAILANTINTGTILYGTKGLTNGHIYSNARKNIIIDGLQMNGTDYATGGTHTVNNYGIYLSTSTSYSVVNNVQTYKQSNYGIYANSTYTILRNIKSYNNNPNGDGIYLAGDRNMLSDILVYNNQYGLYMQGANYNTIDNLDSSTQIRLVNTSNYNTFNNLRIHNAQYGMEINSSSYNTINNSQFYNNSARGLYTVFGAYNTVNNSQFYNNDIGLYFSIQYNTVNNSQFYNNNYGIYSITNNNIINNTSLYNNLYGIYWENSTNNKYYGNIKVFDNKISGIYFSGSSSFTTGGSEYSALGRSAGSITSGGTMSCKLAINPINPLGLYLNNSILQDCAYIGSIASWISTGTSTSDATFVFGKDMMKQILPVFYSGSVLTPKNGLNYNTGWYIGQSQSLTSSVNVPMGYISFSPNAGYTTSQSIDINLEVTENMNYVITGDVQEGTINGNLNDSGIISITLSAGYGIKTVYATFSTGGYTYTTVFDRIKYVDIATMNAEKSIIDGYYSSGYYTSGWTFNNCNTGDMLVQYLNPGTNTIPQLSGRFASLTTGMVGNTIYILSSGNYITSQPINIGGNCTAIIGSGNVTIYSDKYLNVGMINLNGRNNNVLENISLNGVGNGIGGTHATNNLGLYLYNSQNNYINNIQSYSNTNHGVSLLYSNFNTINNSKFYSNGQNGIYIQLSSNNSLIDNKSYSNSQHGIHLQSSTNSLINANQTYSNTQYGIYFAQNSNYNAINNCQEYNNQYGIYFDTSKNNIINNNQNFNNVVGMYFYNNSTYNTINDSQSYDNTNYGIYVSSDYTTINNVQTYDNNSYGIILNASYSVVNNSQAYNNTYGISSAGTSGVINNSQFYNNVYGAYLAGFNSGLINNSQFYSNNQYGLYLLSNSKNNRYYGDIKIFDNKNIDIYIASNSSGVIAGGSEYSSLGRSAGSMTTGGKMNCKFVTNPINLSGIYLENTVLQNCSFSFTIGSNWIANSGNVNYIFGKNIMKQIAPVYIATGNTISIATGLTYNTGRYIGQTEQISGSSKPMGYIHFAPNAGYTTSQNAEIKLEVSDNMDYTITGDIQEGTINGNLTDSGVISVTLSAGYSIKTVYATFSTGGYTYQTILDRIKYVDSATMNSEKDIINGYYNSGYYTSGWLYNKCDTGDMIVQYLNPGSGTIAQLVGKFGSLGTGLIGNTIYILQSGSYITSQPINIGSHCTAIVGSSKTTILSDRYFASNVGMINTNIMGNIILDSLYVNGSGNGIGGTHSRNYNGIYIQSSNNNTINNVEIFDHGNQGIYFYYGYYSTIKNSKFYNDGTYGLYFIGDNNVINNIESYSNGYGIYLNGFNYGTISNSKFYNNSSIGLMTESSRYNTMDNIQTYANNGNGIYLYRGSNYNTVSNSQSYNNGQAGIYSYSTSNNIYNLINNVQTYNNGDYGIIIQATDYSTINNVQSYNNATAGVIAIGTYNTISNIQSYNNGNEGVRQQGTSGILNNIQSYNNGTYGLLIYANTKYYGNTKYFGNKIGDIQNAGYVLSGGGSEYNSIGRSAGSISTGGGMSCKLTNNLFNGSGLYFQNSLLQDCNYVGRIYAWNESNLHYVFGANVQKQKAPVSMSGSSVVVNTGLTFNTGWYIGQTQALSSSINVPMGYMSFSPNAGYTTAQNMQIKLEVSATMDYMITGDIQGGTINGTISDSGTIAVTLSTGYEIKTVYATFSSGGYTYPRILDRIKYTDETTMNGDRNIINGYYNSGYYTSGWAYNKCDTGDMIVQNLDPGTDTIPQVGGNRAIAITTGVMGNTMYILQSGNYITSKLINIANHCTAIVGSGKSTIYSSQNQNYILGFDQRDNNIVDNIYIDGKGNGTGGIHTVDNYGIYSPNSVNKSNSNTIINTQVFNNNNGIYLYSTYTTIRKVKSYNNSNDGLNLFGTYSSQSFYNMIDDSQFYNNGGQGIYLQYCLYSTINNIQSYNNASYGVVLGTSYSTINNSQIYNNANYGLRLNGSYNTVNKNQIYNNTSHGIYLNLAQYNVINNSQVYNNNATGIYLYNGSSNNKYYGNITLFNNKNGNVGVYVSSTFITGGSEYSYLGRTSGNIISGGATMDCSYSTNPMNYSGTLLQSATGACSKTGNIGTWSTNIANGYIYGSGIMKQTRPVMMTGATPSFSNLSYNTSQYIAETDAIPGYISYSPTTTTSGTVTGTLIEPTYTDTARFDLINNSGNIDYNFAKNGYFDFNYLDNILTTTGSLTARVTWIIDTVAPVVELLLPTSGTRFNTGNISFSWSGNDDGGMSGYSYQVSLNSGFTSTVKSGNMSTGAEYVSINITGLVNNQYFWKVKGIDTRNNSGWTTYNNFYVDLLAPTVQFISPTTGEVVYGISVNLIWSGNDGTGSGISGYIYQIATDAGFTTMTNTGTIYGTSVVITGLDEDTYYWRVNAFDIVGNQSNYLSGNSFQILFNIPSTDLDDPIVETIYPLSGDNLFDSSTGYLVRSGNDGTGVGISGYDYQVSTLANFSNIIRSGTVATTGVQLVGLNNSNYYRRIRGVDNSGNTSEYVTGYMFKVFDIEGYLFGLSYVKGTGSLKNITASTFVGTNTIDTNFIKGLQGISKITRQVVLRSTGTDIVEVRIPTHTNFKNASGGDYTGTISAPIAISTGIVASGAVSGDVYGAIRVGNTGSSILLQNDAGSSINATITIPVSGMTVGGAAAIYYSNDDIVWNKLKETPVVSIAGKTYVEFTVTHFTDYIVTIGTGTNTMTGGCVGMLSGGTCLVLNVSAGTLRRGAPESGLDLGVISTSPNLVPLSGQFQGNDMLLNYFRVEDMKGASSGWYTYVQVTNLTGLTNTGIFIPASMVYIRSDTGLTLLNGTANSTYNGLISTYESLDTIRTFIQRDPGDNNGAINIYGHQPWIQVNVPGFTTPGAYRGQIYFTMYDRS